METSEAKKKGRKPTALLPEADKERAVQDQIERRLMLVSPPARVEMLEFFLKREKRGLEGGQRPALSPAADPRQLTVEGA